VQSLLLDRAVQVRRIAQEQLAPLVQIDPPAVYLDTLRSPGGNLVTVLRGLGETGSKANVGAILPFWDDDRPGVQRAAVAARASLDPDPNPAPFLDKLVNPRPGVSREAERALESRLHLVPVHVLTELFDSSDLHHVRSNTFRLLARLGKWASIAPILHGLSPRFGEEINERAHAFLNRWFGRYNVDWSVPRKSDLDALETALREQSDVPYRGFLVAVLAEWRERIGA
jgi:HEAT repeat protein